MRPGYQPGEFFWMSANYKQALEQIIDLAQQVATPLGLSVLDVGMSQQGRQRSVAVTIFRPAGSISLDDCQTVSRQLEELLDNQSPHLIEGSYLLDVQSPGIDRQLKSDREFSAFSNHLVEVKTKETIGSLGSVFSGTLLAKNNGLVVIGNPRKVQQLSASSRKPKIKAHKSVEADDTAALQVEIDMSKVIHIRLMSEQPQLTNI